jgi:electron transfer flavoprotein beta subunit
VSCWFKQSINRKEVQMKIVVPIQLVPDLVEELVVDKSGVKLDPDAIAWIVNEFDDHAIEQAILLKERGGGEVIVIAPDLPNTDDVLFAAAAKGADKLIKVCADFESGFNGHGIAAAFAPVIDALKPDLVLTGVQVHNGMDGQVGAVLAEKLSIPYVGYISGVKPEGDKVIAQKDYPGGLKAEMVIKLPAVLGIQAADTPPRYVPISKIRQFMKTAKIDEEDGALETAGGVKVTRMYLPEVAERATMIEGGADAIAERLVEIFKEQGIL